MVILICCSAFSSGNAQNTATVSGKITGPAGEGLEGVTVWIEDSNFGSYTDETGWYRLESIPPGHYVLRARFIGYREQQIFLILASAEQRKVDFVLEEESYRLGEVRIQEKSDTRLAKEQTITAKVLDVKSLAVLPSALTAIMNRTAGVRIRESGGLGNNADISINGFQGRSVRYFKDGIPLDYLGDGYNISVLPLSTVDRVEIYKGVLPVSLGADALGGAVNLVSNTSAISTLRASYETGSYNTHRAALSGYYSTKNSKSFFGVEGFYNYSKNDYEVKVRVPDPETKNPSWLPVRLFHNGYEGYFTEGYAGVKNRSWADELKISLVTFGIHRQQQHPTLMNTPYGAIRLRQQAWIPTLRYKKSLFDGRLSIDQFVGYSNIDRNRVDTARGHYTWWGEFIPNSHKIGESSQPALSDVNFRNFISRTNLIFRLGEHHRLEGNMAMTSVRRKGEDPLGMRFLHTDIDVLSIPATYRKTVGGLGWNVRFAQEKLTNDLIIKVFGYHSEGVDGYLASGTSLQNIQGTRGSSWGLAEGIKYQIRPDQLLRLSLEYTNRLPDQEELFGNSDTRVPNFDLNPERSFNVNLNYGLEKEIFRLEAGMLYRQTQGMILLIPVQPPFAQYRNLENVRGYGFDLDGDIRFRSFLHLTGNVTWLNNRMFDIKEASERWKEGTRLRNTPFFFYNLGLSGGFYDLIHKKDRFRYYVYYNFIREFYLDFIPRKMEPSGFMGLWGNSGVDVTTRIPDQHSLSAGLHYKFHFAPVEIGFEIRNLTDERLYDFYRVEKAGRSFHLKFNYLIQSNI